MRILVTNDDGIDSLGLHVLARAVRPFGDVVVAAPDKEYSGAGAAIGALHVLQPEVHEASIEGIDEAWAVTGAPALCVMYARLGLFGDPFDLVVSGINPGANVGRSIYHSGTVGACLTARNGGVSGIAVSQAVEHFGIEGQGWDEVLEDQPWETAGVVAASVVGGFIGDLPDEPEVLNINVPNTSLDELKGWRRTEVGMVPPRSVGTAVRVPKEGHAGAYKVEMEWGESADVAEHLDAGAVMNGWVSFSCLGRIESIDSHCPAVKQAEAGLDDLLG